MSKQCKDCVHLNESVKSGSCNFCNSMCKVVKKWSFRSDFYSALLAVFCL